MWEGRAQVPEQRVSAGLLRRRPALVALQVRRCGLRRVPTRHCDGVSACGAAAHRPHAAMRAAGRVGCVDIYVLRGCAPQRAGSVTAAATRCGSPPSSARLPSVAYTYLYDATIPASARRKGPGNTMQSLRMRVPRRRGRASERTYTDRGQLIPRTRTRSEIPLSRFDGGRGCTRRRQGRPFISADGREYTERDWRL